MVAVAENTRGATRALSHRLVEGASGKVGEAGAATNVGGMGGVPTGLAT